MQTTAFLQLLKDSSLQLLAFADELRPQYSIEILETADGPGRWNCIQVLEHLNSYYRYYFPLFEKEFDRKMTASRQQPPSDYRASWLGGYLTRSMLPKQNALALKMKAFKNHSPVAGMDANKVIAEFIGQQRRLIELINRAAAVDLRSIRIGISIARWVKLPLGDLLSFLVAHNERHHFQMEKLLGLAHLPFALEQEWSKKTVGT
ncbi:MAG TPA: DinB family protein [Flavihumibacter sp.]|nr:DinB family protein [Bacteroidota bacterium]HOA37004.1 DinB family protein [Flavihumibacter sp.]HPZ89402.1 DinB family protein [Flavihumibacter sp.]HQD08056.1 DinB family protein [Flavihumibacter sp.]